MEDSREYNSQYSNPLFIWALIFSAAVGIVDGLQGVLVYAYMIGGVDLYFFFHNWLRPKYCRIPPHLSSSGFDKVLQNRGKI